MSLTFTFCVVPPPLCMTSARNGVCTPRTPNVDPKAFPHLRLLQWRDGGEGRCLLFSRSRACTRSAFLNPFFFLLCLVSLPTANFPRNVLFRCSDSGDTYRPGRGSLSGFFHKSRTFSLPHLNRDVPKQTAALDSFTFSKLGQGVGELNLIDAPSPPIPSCVFFFYSFANSFIRVRTVLP